MLRVRVLVVEEDITTLRSMSQNLFSVASRGRICSAAIRDKEGALYFLQEMGPYDIVIVGLSNHNDLATVVAEARSRGSFVVVIGEKSSEGFARGTGASAFLDKLRHPSIDKLMDEAFSQFSFGECD